MQLHTRLAQGRQHPSSIRPAADSSYPSSCCCKRPLSSCVVVQAHKSGSNSSSKSDGYASDEDRIWSQLAFPSYLQNKHRPEVCKDFDKAVTAAERRQARDALGLAASVDEEEEEEFEPETVWHTIRREAERDAAAEPLLSSFLYASILAHDTFERALAFVLSNRLANAVMLPTQLFEIFHNVLVTEPDVRDGALADVEACRERDPACTSFSQALLYYKGYHAIQTHRIAHALWARGQKVMAVALQSRMSEVLAVDIHPAARFGRGILLDHGTGVVIGETAVIGNNVSLLQNVTLGGTGKDHGDRHPKISDHVLIGACATVLGNITVGEGAQIAAGSLVLKPVEPHTMVAGSPAKAVGHVTGNPAEKMQQWNKKLLNWDPFAEAAAEAPAMQQQQQQPEQQQPPRPASAADGGAAAAGSNGSAAAGSNGSAAAAAGAPNGSSSSSKSSSTSSSRSQSPLPKPTLETVIAAEKRWAELSARVDAATGKLTATGSSSGSNGRRLVNGAAAVPAAAANGHSLNGSSTSSRSSSPLPEQPMQQATHLQQQQPKQQQQQRLGMEALQQPAATTAQDPGGAAGGDAASGAAAGALNAAAAGSPVGRKQAASEIKGVHEGTVDATLDEEVAAELWASRKEEPEYVI